MKKVAVLFFASAFACAVAATPATAESTPAPQSGDTSHPAVDPAALSILKATSEKLAAAKTISFHALGAFDVPARNGQPLFYYNRSEVLLARPNKLRVIVPGDGAPSEFYFDGSTVAVFRPSEDLIAVANVPGNLDEMLEKMYQKAGIYFPFVDFLVSDPYKALTNGLTSAFVIGKSKLVGGVTTDVVSISDEHVHLQIWIGEQDKLPRLIWASAAEAGDRPRHMVEFSNWKLNGSVAKETFAARRTPKTKEIPFARPEEASSAKKP
ncbi:DUF2092 domain-containing protein [Methylocapsa palsarum]|uniref:Outer membrane lipoprotein-sorting protein n=1 Tax=Methylocapsa palsarum TaxID=1612308 RepID=A0A1I4BK19_9HYPH|nr:DUF2092 domain-containing protein [Methylocapsa palsarum]SFK68296.1 hypothetical protein SAMN05444581_11512 [Methylocapsa palsarum]